MNDLHNAGFERWPTPYYMLEDTAQRTADGWLNGPGVGGRLTVSRQAQPLGAAPDCRYYMHCEWLVAGYEPGPDPWLTFLEYGEAHGAPPQGGVRQHHGKTVRHSIWARVASGSVPVRLIAWQSFGYGPEASPFVLIPSEPVMVGQSWTRVERDIPIPSVWGKAVGSGGGDYLGFGVEIPNYYGPVMDLALAERHPVT